MRKAKGQVKRRWWIAVMLFCCIFMVGRTKSADTVLADAVYDYIIPGSNTYYLTEADISDMPIQVLCYARNEIYARYGRRFESSELQAYFDSKSWYSGSIDPSAFSNTMLNSYETANIELLKNREYALRAEGYLLDQNGYSYQPIYDYLYGKNGFSDSYVFYGSDMRYIMQSEVNTMTLQEICYAKNEIYARHGRMFDSQELKDYFWSKSWYNGCISPEDFSDSVFNTYELANIKLLQDNELARSASGYLLDQPGYNIYAVGSYGSMDDTYIFYDSNSRYLTNNDVRNLSIQEICYARNEIYARRGRLFESMELQNYFNQKTWYYGWISPESFSPSVLNQYETANVEFLKNYEYMLDPKGYILN
ncbi:MAG: YARHG domain-containing protein [Eubacteriales bacterium]|nr:YARHG domain-containing protein [Eubacteriales bacterium]